MNNITVGLTVTQPSTMPPTDNGYALCGQWMEDVPAGQAPFIICAADSPLTRYVVIFGYQELNVCELEIYGKSNLLYIYNSLQETIRLMARLFPTLS